MNHKAIDWKYGLYHFLKLNKELNPREKGLVSIVVLSMLLIFVIILSMLSYYQLI